MCKMYYYNGACYGKCGDYMPGGMYKGQWDQSEKPEPLGVVKTVEVEEYLTIRDAQYKQPWRVPYARGVINARNDVPHILGTHCALHAAKSLGKIAAVFEALDHPTSSNTEWGPSSLSDDQLKTVKDMSADLMTAALRFANLYGFDLETELRKRVKEKNEVKPKTMSDEEAIEWARGLK